MQAKRMGSSEHLAEAKRHGHQHEQAMGGHGMQMNPMYFHSGLGDLFLVRDFVLSSPLRLALVCLFVLLAAILVEALDYLRGRLSCRCHVTSQFQPADQKRHSSSTELIGTTGSELPTSGRRSPQDAGQGAAACCGEAHLATGRPIAGRQLVGRAGAWCSPRLVCSNRRVPLGLRLLQAALQFVRTGLALTLMLVAMTYNECLIFSIMLGEWWCCWAPLRPIKTHTLGPARPGATPSRPVES